LSNARSPLAAQANVKAAKPPAEGIARGQTQSIGKMRHLQHKTCHLSLFWVNGLAKRQAIALL
jgi:hypothetical protein